MNEYYLNGYGNSDNYKFLKEEKVKMIITI